MNCKKVLIIGAGLTGATISRVLASKGFQVDIFDCRDHIGGNCYDERDSQTNIMVHKYGPHIFHTDNEKVWRFVNQFAEFMPYILRVKAKAKGQVFTLPVNLHTINQFFKKSFTPSEALNYIEALSDNGIGEPKSFEEVGLKSVGKEIYNTFFKSYAEKQWGMGAEKIPAGVLKRLPLRFNYDDNYFNHRYQGIPRFGYTSLIENILKHENINVTLNQKINRKEAIDLLKSQYNHIVFTGPVDEFYDYEFGELPYRTLEFYKYYAEEDQLGCAVMSHPEAKVPFTRITEHKYFTPWESHLHNGSVLYKEYSRQAKRGDIPYYPVRTTQVNPTWEQYEEACRNEKGISFAGRLAVFKYMDMDVCIEEALKKADDIISKLN